jgi:hypothetical protein
MLCYASSNLIHLMCTVSPDSIIIFVLDLMLYFVHHGLKINMCICIHIYTYRYMHTQTYTYNLSI